MRQIAALTLLLVPAIACAEWKPEDRAAHYAACLKASGESASVCACIIRELEQIQPDPKAVVLEDVVAAFSPCILPPNTKDTVVL